MRVEAHWQELGSRPVRSLRAGAPYAAVPQLVFVTGLNASDLLMPTLRACSAWTRVHLLDVPGFGHRRTSRFPSTLIDVADVIAEWLTVTDLPRAVLVGHSTGAQAAVRAARAVPERAEAVILAGPTFPPAARRWWPLVARVMRTIPNESLGEVRAAFPEYLRGRRRLWTFLLTSMSDEPERVVGGLRCRVVIMRGVHDALADHQWAARLAADAHADMVITVPGAHNFPYTHPRAAADAVRRVAAGLPVGSDQRLPRPPSGNDRDGVA